MLPVLEVDSRTGNARSAPGTGGSRFPLTPKKVLDAVERARAEGVLE